jgi:UDP-GlcNAc:undecaprenyl-phosphate/decaprenyl-phosphate GlcNAc-1-phosphate transferase
VTLSYIEVFAAGLLLALVLTPYVRNLALAHGWVDAPDSERHFHTRPVPRLGGLSILIAFLGGVGISLLLGRLAGGPPPISIRTTLAILAPALIVFLSGLYDDLHSLGPYWKFSTQVVAAVLLYFGGFGIHRLDLLSKSHALHVSVGLPLTVLWVVLITNAFNLIDGLDGLAAGSALFSIITLFVLSFMGRSLLVSFLDIGLAGAILGFLRYNFNPATIFLGDSGSLFIGFMLSALALAGSQKATAIVAVSIPVVSFGLPIMDVVISIARRFLSGKPLFIGDYNHIHHKLLKRGLSHRDAVLVLYAVTAGFGMFSLALLHGGGIIAFVLAVIGLGVLVGVQQLQYSEFSELAAFFSQLQPRQIIANHLQVRQATMSLQACHDVPELCRILTETMAPLGFEGFSIRLEPDLKGSAFEPLAKDSGGELKFSWGAHPAPEVAWELKLDLVSATGDKYGSFSFQRPSQRKPLLMDMNLLTDGFQSTLSIAVQRTIFKTACVENPQAQHAAVTQERAADASARK